LEENKEQNSERSRDENASGSCEDAEGEYVPDVVIDTEGAGKSFISPRWLTELGRLWGGASDVPVVEAAPEDVGDLLGGALFQALYKWMLASGSIYLLPTGPISSFLIVSEPAAAKHILRSSDNARRNVYGKGLVAEVSKFLFGDGFAVAEGQLWTARRKAVAPSLHRAYLEIMVDKVFAPSAHLLNKKLKDQPEGKPIDIESCFSQLTLDIIGKALFNYDFNALTKDSPIIQAVYTALKETEQRATDLLPYWKIPLFNLIDERQRKAAEAVQIIRDTTEELISKCKQIVEEEQKKNSGTTALDLGEDYVDEADPSILRFLIAARDEVSSTQLRDDLLSMLVAGHETTASVLTWTIYLLLQNPECMKKAVSEVDAVLGSKTTPSFSDLKNCPYVLRCISESMRLYPHPPVLIRRALMDDRLPGGQFIPKGQDVIVSVYNIHHSPEVWDDPEEFIPERFPLDKQAPTEINTDFRYIPFSGGPRKCIGDQFALMEAQVALIVLLKEIDLELVPDQKIEMTTGATIHTKDGLFVTSKARKKADAKTEKEIVV
jgi:carotene epsilon-monooxygenase